MAKHLEPRLDFSLNRDYTICFKEKDISVTVRGGENAIENPSLLAPADFEWKSKSHGFFKTRGNQTIFDIEVRGTKFKGTFNQPVHWDSRKEGTSFHHYENLLLDFKKNLGINFL